MKGHTLRITFDFEPGSCFDLYERIAFWDSPDTIQFFKEHGYTLYKRIGKDDYLSASTEPALPFQDFAEGVYPYSYYDARTVDSDPTPLRASEPGAKVAFAQDSLNRHVAIKLVRDGTEEYRIMRFLSQQRLETLKDNCVVPVLELLPVEGFWFAVMPRRPQRSFELNHLADHDFRWGESPQNPPPKIVQDVLGFMHGMLKGLAFLHEHNISHGDMHEGNLLINHFCDVTFQGSSNIRQDLRFQQSLSYCVFDFDFAVMLSPDEDRGNFRLPCERSYGTFAKIKDTYQGELDYNPFVFDVGNVGVTFCRLYQHLTKEIPFLAPLLDKMTTRDLDRRFKASEALRFFEDMTSQLSQSELEVQTPQRERGEQLSYDLYDRWSHVPVDFARKWEIYKEPPLPWTTKVLRWLCERRWGHYIVAIIRRFLSGMISFPRRVHTHFVGFRIRG
ncbi:hypothetical protein GALMADRAFT_87668 [Galerina marginata CBS 339.88]|uniref:Protein kinase domain-containing protein n=1 Tax=Galerina marginata (strain CBS 339.88) TaxID=685588 RepID=A0A067TGX0_GALM3|nr:hypothetical protein GALMADRAFT_87668 [Galerina marginata CBS 339.88]